MPTARYYVLPVEQHFQVKREGKSQGVHGSLVRAIEAAKFMASIEASNGTAAEVLADEGLGLRSIAEYLPDATKPARTG